MGGRKGGSMTVDRVLLVAALLGVMVLSGCQAMRDDFTALKDDLIPPSPRQAAQDMVDPYDAEKRRRGTMLIANAPFGGAEPYVRLYADKVQYEENPLALTAAIRALARHGGPEHTVLVAERLRHESAQVRWEAAKGLQRLHEPEIVPVLLAVVRDESEDVDVRQAAIIALGQYPEDRVFQALVSPTALDARELELNIAARASLRTLTGHDLGSTPGDWLAWYNGRDAPFADQEDYFFPTYSRKESFLEVLAFWTNNHWESSQQPAGLRQSGARSTYEDDDEVSEGASDSAGESSDDDLGG